MDKEYRKALAEIIKPCAKCDKHDCPSCEVIVKLRELKANQNPPKPSAVDHPSHYNLPGKKECIVEIQEKYGRLIILGFDLGNAEKYCYRAGYKNEKHQDISKAEWYCNHYASIWNSLNWFQKLVFKFAKWVCS